ncbi:MAG: helix-turn-helix domain-containing protein [Marinibacterium sp.]|nr:helix-turn-helix domain-containing protein [Marinibacterium sp.]
MDDARTEDWYGPHAATFGDRLAAAREGAEMTQSQLAKRLGVKKSTLVAWEQDLSEPRANKLSMAAGMLNVSIMWLLTGEGEGMSAPEDDGSPEIVDLSYALRELTEIRAQMRATQERAARLEKRLREMVK